MVMRLSDNGGVPVSKQARKAAGLTKPKALSKPAPPRNPVVSLGSGMAGRGYTPTQNGRNFTYTPPKPAAPKPAPAPSPAPSYSGGSLATSATGTVAQPVPVPEPPPAPEPPKPPSDEDWWKSDDAFIAEQGSLKNNLDRALANLTQQRSSYDTDLISTLKNLGWTWGGGSPSGIEGFEQGSWDPNNMLGAYGQGVYNLNNDFAARGLLDSSFFNDATNNFNTDMNNQFSGLVSNRNQFLNARTSDEETANSTYQNALKQAKAESLARRAAQFGVL